MEMKPHTGARRDKMMPESAQSLVGESWLTATLRKWKRRDVLILLFLCLRLRLRLQLQLRPRLRCCRGLTGQAAGRGPDWATLARGRRDVSAAPGRDECGAGVVERGTMTPPRIRCVIYL